MTSEASGSLVAASSKQSAILILGAHRSGTSALAGTLTALGGGLPGNLIPPAPDNPKGFFESEAIVAFNDVVLSRLGLSWEDPAPTPDEDHRDVLRAAAHDLYELLQTELPDIPLILLKDPRICRLAPTWLSVLDRLTERTVCILVGRHPVEVADSLRRRNDLSRAQGLALWLEYVLDSERHTRGRARTFVLYDELLADWRQVCMRLDEALGISWPKSLARSQDDIDDFLAVDLRHQKAVQPEIAEVDELHALCGAVWQAFQQLARDPTDAKALSNLDRARTSYLQAWALIGPLVAAGQAALARTTKRLELSLAEKDAELVARGAVISEQESVLREQQDVALAREARLADAAASLDAARHTIDERDQRIVFLNHAADALGAANKVIAERDGEVAALQEELQRTRSEFESHAQRLRTAEICVASETAAAAAARQALKQHQAAQADAIEQARMKLVNEAAARRWREHAATRRHAEAERDAQRQTRDEAHALRAELQANRSQLQALRAELQANRSQLQALQASRALRAAQAVRRWAGALRGAPPSGRTPEEANVAVASSIVPSGPSSEQPAVAPAQPRHRLTAAPRPAAAAAAAAAFPLPSYVIAASELSDKTNEVLDVTASVVIPTYNAGTEFYWLLRKLRAQKGLKAVEIVIVDSGSTDQTIAFAEQMGCRLVHCDKRDFSHSHNRNIGADHSVGEVILFTVQDAYPVGDYWLHALARALLHPRTEEERLAAVSCTERPRSDTELMYNELIDGHYRFLQCSDGDRLGRFITDDSMSVRVQGQLSDIACMVTRSLFMQYRYFGRYAEDLTLGIRLVRDGHKAGMLSSVQVIHSHHRTSSYHLRRVFVDVLFLAEVFPDTFVPPDVGLVGAALAAYQLQAMVAAWRPGSFGEPVEALDDLIARVAAYRVPFMRSKIKGDGFGFTPLATWLTRYEPATPSSGGAMDPLDIAGGEQVRNIFLDRLSNSRRYVERVLAGMDDRIAGELSSAAEKSLAMSLGAQLAYTYLNDHARGGEEFANLRDMLLEGI